MWAIRLQVASVAAACAAVAACASNPAPRGWLAPAQAAESDPYGAWIVVRHDDPEGGPTLETAGELIAVESDTVFVLPQSGPLSAIPLRHANEGRLAYYDSRSEYLGLWTFMGILSTASHGYFLVISAPVWIISGSIASASQSRAPLVRVTRSELSQWRALTIYARFPAGIPPGLARDRLRPKTR
jgi:hypothetical protein